MKHESMYIYFFKGNMSNIPFGKLEISHKSNQFPPVAPLLDKIPQGELNKKGSIYWWVCNTMFAIDRCPILTPGSYLKVKGEFFIRWFLFFLVRVISVTMKKE